MRDGRDEAGFARKTVGSLSKIGRIVLSRTTCSIPLAQYYLSLLLQCYTAEENDFLAFFGCTTVIATVLTFSTIAGVMCFCVVLVIFIFRVGNTRPDSVVE